MPSASNLAIKLEKQSALCAYTGKQGEPPMICNFIMAGASVAVLTLSVTAFAQKADHGTADEAKAMLAKTVAA